MEITRKYADRRLSAHASNLVSNNGGNSHHREYERRCDSTTSVPSLKVIPPKERPLALKNAPHEETCACCTTIIAYRLQHRQKFSADRVQCRRSSTLHSSILGMRHHLFRIRAGIEASGKDPSSPRNCVS